MNSLRETEDYIVLKKQFDAYYEDKLKDVLRQSEAVRYRYLLMLGILVLFIVAVYPSIIYYMLTTSLFAADTSKGIIEGATALAAAALCGPFYFYKKKVKPRIMPDFAGFFGTFSYVFEGKIDDDRLRRSDLFKPFDKNKGDDYFHGTYEGVKISIAEEKLVNTGKDITGKDIEKNVFTGICVLFEMNKNFSGRTVVLEDKGVFNAFQRVSGLEKVKLEDIYFEKCFEVFSDDQIEARYLLTTGFMERMLRLRDLYNGKSIRFCFEQNHLLLAIPNGRDMFEAASFFRSNMNKAKIDVVFEQFYTIFSIVKILKINQKTGL